MYKSKIMDIEYNIFSRLLQPHLELAPDPASPAPKKGGLSSPIAEPSPGSPIAEPSPWLSPGSAPALLSGGSPIPAQGSVTANSYTGQVCRGQGCAGEGGNLFYTAVKWGGISIYI